jgi:hypothetical protein
VLRELPSRPPRGKGTLVALAIGALAVVLVAVVVLGGFGRPTSTSGSPLPSGALSPYLQALRQIRNDGSFSKDTALAAFAASIGPLPGVATPAADASYRSGTAALQMVEAYWAELTREQRDAVRGYLGEGANAVLPPEASSGVELVAFRPPDVPVPARLGATYQEIAEQAATEIAAGIGHPLGIQIQTLPSPNENGGAWAWAEGNWNEVPAGHPATRCLIWFPPSTVNDQSRAPYLHWLLLHEVWHCFESLLVGLDEMVKVPKWISEGEASWVAEAITNGAGAPPPERTYWDLYLLAPAVSLYARTYDAVGFWAQLAQAAIDPWTVLEPAYKAGASGSDPGLIATGATNPTFVDRWGSSWFRDGSPGNAWAMTGSYGIPPVGDHATSQFFQIGDGDNGQIDAEPNTAAIADIQATAFVTRFEGPAGSGRVGDVKPAGLDRVVRATYLDVCTNPGGDCSCPNGGGLTDTTPPAAGPNLRAAATGEQHGQSIVQFRGISKDEWCGPSSAPPEKPCQTDCGSSNGDPHMRTIDGHRYDLQAAGEFVLLRSADGLLEIQARQETTPCGTGTCGVTASSAIAVRVNGHRVGFYRRAQVPDVQIDGALVAPADVGSVDIGAGARLTAYQKGYQLDLPDGSTVWVLAVGSRGMNVLVQPSAALRDAGVGLLAPVPPSAKFFVPALPDGSTLPAPLDRHDRWHLLYEVLAPAWRVSQATSLFDYEGGRTPDSYVVADFPPEQAPLSIEDVDPAALAPARTACAQVTDPDLADQCAFDVATTGSDEYVALYLVSNDLEERGPAALDPVPNPTPTPPTGGGGVPTGIVQVADKIANASFAVLGPDGTLYVQTYEVDRPFDTDPTAVLLAMDGSTGTMRKRVVNQGESFGYSGGRLAYAAGSVWSAEFMRKESECSVSRLDPQTLDVRARVTTVCFDGRTVMVTLDDAPWFIDPTGAGANGAGAHLRRVNPATNALDTTPAGSIELPFANSLLGIAIGVMASTSEGVFFGERQDGVFRINAGDHTIDPLGKPGAGYGFFAAGTGVWTQTSIGTSEEPEGMAEHFTGDATSAARAILTGYLIGADNAAVYGSDAADEDQADGFWRFPIDGGSERLATSGLVDSGFGGQVRLSYRDPGAPLLIGDGLAVKLWIAASPNPDYTRLLFQSIPLR